MGGPARIEAKRRSTNQWEAAERIGEPTPGRCTVRYADGVEEDLPYGRVRESKRRASSFARVGVPEEEPPLRVVAVDGAPRPVPKPRGRLRLEAYLAFVRGLNCCGCGAEPPSDPHHWSDVARRGVSTKIDDLLTLPLCRACHSLWHGKRAVPGRTKAETVLLFLSTQVQCLVAFYVEQMDSNPEGDHERSERARGEG